MIYAIGDVHGEADALAEMLATLPVTVDDTVIFLGDLINRGGADPFRCVELAISFDRCRRFALMGNHEEAMLMLLENGDWSAMSGMDCQNTLDSYDRAGYPIRPGDPASIPDAHARYYFQAEPWTLPYYITETHIFVHAGWDLSRDVRTQSQERWRWGAVAPAPFVVSIDSRSGGHGRSRVQNGGPDRLVWTQTVVRGHTPIPKVRHNAEKRTIGVDTGCGLGGMLSAVAIPGEEVYTVRPASYRPRWFAGMMARGRCARPMQDGGQSKLCPYFQA